MAKAKVMTLNTLTKLYIWHHPADTHCAVSISKLLNSPKWDVRFQVNENSSEDLSFSTIDWQLSTIDSIIFIISKHSIGSSNLNIDIKKVLRGSKINIVPAIMDDEGFNNFPYMLKFLPVIDLRTIEFESNRDLPTNELRTKLLQIINPISAKHSITNPIRWITNHFRHYFSLRPLSFCWQITIENLIVSLSITGLIQLIFRPDIRTNLDNLSITSFILLVIIVSPLFETVILQTLPVFLSRKYGFQFFGQVFSSMVPFAILHFSRGIGTGIGAGIIGGFYSAFTYVHWRNKSFWTAFWVTALSHGLYNLALFAMIIGDY